ncbi:uncharacterized protein K441DRAFT_669911, partial [Cenococcum geophilum 1.58]
MGRRLHNKVVHRIRTRIKASKTVLAIAEAVKRLLNLFKDQPTAYIDKMQAFLFN